MINFKVSAPGNLTLCGEHMTMYGGRVVVASLNLRTTLKFCDLDNSRDMVKIEFPDVNLSLNLSLELILTFFFENEYANSILEDCILLHRKVQYFITSLGLWITYEQKFSLQTFLFLFIWIANKEKIDITPFHVHLITQLPIKAGFSSSTSFAVCLAACFVHWKRLQEGDAHNEFNEQELRRITIYANWCEKVAQNYIIRTYTEVCTYGQIYRYRYKNGNRILPLAVPRMNILLIDSGIRQNKYQQMENLAEMRNSYPDDVNNILNLIDRISMGTCRKLNAIYDIQENNNWRQLDEIYLALGIYFQANQNLLNILRLSHPNLNRICWIANVNGLGAKLTSFGGRAYILLPPDASEEFIAHILVQLIMIEGFTVTRTSMSCSGVRIDDGD